MLAEHLGVNTPTPILGAACAGHKDPELWYAEGHAAVAVPRRAEAKAICGGCPARVLCLEEALREEAAETHSGRFGIRGGLDPVERARVAGAPTKGCGNGHPASAMIFSHHGRLLCGTCSKSTARARMAQKRAKVKAGV